MMTEDTLTALRNRYAEPEIPKCSICGGELSIQRSGGGSPTIWACSGMIDDPTGERTWIYAEGRSMADDHYERSRWTDYRRGGDSDVIDLINAYKSLTQPASPALKLPDVPPNALVALCEQMYDHRSTGATVAHDVWQVCVEELLMDAPHTTPIEPICATGGAEWVKCSDRMPESKPGMWSKEVAAVSELGDVFKLSAMGKYWQRSKAFVESGAEEITHWMPLPEDT